MVRPPSSGHFAEGQHAPSNRWKVKPAGVSSCSMAERREKEPEHEPAGQEVQYNIGQAAEATGISAKMIRYYESIGLIPKAVRAYSNYRLYGRNDLHTLRFIRRARDLGFSIEQIKTLLALWRHRRPSGEVKRVALGHIAELEEKIRALDEMRRTLVHLVEHCHGDDRPACPILDELADNERPGGRNERH
jgi:MerR family transcriptional regulator, copper efflux regulator